MLGLNFDRIALMGADDNLPVMSLRNFFQASFGTMSYLKHLIISNNRIDNPQKLAGYGNHCFHFRHTSIKHIMILLVHDPVNSDCIQGGAVQLLPVSY